MNLRSRAPRCHRLYLLWSTVRNACEVYMYVRSICISLLPIHRQPAEHNEWEFISQIVYLYATLYKWFRKYTYIHIRMIVLKKKFSIIWALNYIIKPVWCLLKRTNGLFVFLCEPGLCGQGLQIVRMAWRLLCVLCSMRYIYLCINKYNIPTLLFVHPAEKYSSWLLWTTTCGMLSLIYKNLPWPTRHISYEIYQISILYIMRLVFIYALQIMA